MDSRRCIRGHNVGLVLMLRSKGFTIEQLMDKFHCSDTPLKRIFREYPNSWQPVKRKSGRKLSDERIEQIRWMHEHGQSAPEIAKRIGVHRVTVLKYTKGIKRMKWTG